MKSKVKKLFTLMAAAVMAFAFSATAFAASVTGDYFFRAANGAGEMLNVWGNGVYEGAPIRLYSYTGDSSQKWRVYQASDGSYSLRTMANTALAINKSDSTGNAILWTWANGREDSDMYITTADSGTQYRFWLRSGGTNNYLTADSTSSGGNVAFRGYSAPNSQWKKVG